MCIRDSVNPSLISEVNSIPVSNDLDVSELQKNSFVVVKQKEQTPLQSNEYCYVEYTETEPLTEGIGIDIIGVSAIGKDN